MSITQEIVNAKNNMWINKGVMPCSCRVSNRVMTELRREFVSGASGISREINETGCAIRIDGMRVLESEQLKGGQIALLKDGFSHSRNIEIIDLESLK